MGRLRKRWFGGILKVLGNVTTEEANKRAKDYKLSVSP
jgi:hypothetical protein